jgi:hypothetical protein
MFTEYQNLPKTSRVWIYQTDRELKQTEIENISQKATIFIDNWTRHGDDLKGSFVVKYNHFLILAVDEKFNQVSGCSIDASVRFVQELEKELKIDLMNKMNISFRDGDHINIVKLQDFQKYAKEQKITKETIVFNNMVTTKEDLENQWEVVAEKSWHKRFLV